MFWAFCILAVVTGIWGVFTANAADGMSNGPREGTRNGALVMSGLIGAGLGLVLALFAATWSAVLIGALVGVGACAAGFFGSNLFRD
jgi:hypothetical protein